MYRLGIDLGGTNIAVGVVDESYNIIGRAKMPTGANRSAEEICDDMAKAVDMAISDAKIDKKDIVNFGIGAPGSVNPETGILTHCNNFKFSLVNFPELLKERTGFDFKIANDANAAAYGEYIAGCGKGSDNFIAITLGTGIGSGIVIDGKIYTGENFAAGEIGHTVIQMDGEFCTCGREGCWEAYGSATALIRQTKQAMIKYPDSVLWQLCDGDINKVDGKTAFDAKRMDDFAGKQVVRKYIKYIAVGLSNCINIFQPDTICIGGGISKEGSYLLEQIKKFIDGENYARSLKRKTKIKIAKLGNDAGIIGAAYLE